MSRVPHSLPSPIDRGTGGNARLLAGRPPLKSTPDVWGTRRDVYRAKLVFYLFMVSLGVFFAAGLVSYCFIRLQSFQPIKREYLPLVLPATFLYSTLALVLVSGFLQLAVAFIRREHQVAFRRMLVLSWFAAAAFLVIQYFGMATLLEAHFLRDDGSTKAYGLCFTLAFLHALHVVGGMAFLAFVIFRGFANCYDHERNYAVEHCAAYWHFLDIVWVLMLVTFWATR